MKRCPTCQSTYTDDSLVYCLQDGAHLQPVSTSVDAGATLVLPAPPQTEGQRGFHATTETPPPRLTTPVTRAAPPVSGSRRGILVAVVCALMLGVGALGAWAIFREAEPGTVSSSSSNESRARPAPSAEKSGASGQSASSTGQPSPAAQAVDASALKREVTETLARWAQTIRDRNIEAHISYYTDPLEVYYAQTNVPAGRVRADRVRAFSSYTTLDIKLTNMSIEIDEAGKRAVATFDKTFDFRGEKNYSGSGLNRFTLVKTGGNWRITGEKDLKTYYVNK